MTPMKLTMLETATLKQLVMGEIYDTEELIAEMKSDRDAAEYVKIQEGHVALLQGVLNKLNEEFRT